MIHHTEWRYVGAAGLLGSTITLIVGIATSQVDVAVHGALCFVACLWIAFPGVDGYA